MTKKYQLPCTCPAYPFPHRKHGGKCDAFQHGKDWRGLTAALNDEGDWCPDCAESEGYQGEPDESLSPWERNPSYSRW